MHGRVVVFELLSRVVRANENNFKPQLFLFSILLKELIQHGRKLTTRRIPVGRKEEAEHAARQLGFQVDFLVHIVDHILVQKLNETFVVVVLFKFVNVLQKKISRVQNKFLLLFFLGSTW